MLVPSFFTSRGGQKTVTQDKAYWLLPKGLKSVDYREVSKIGFTSSRTKKRKFVSLLCDPSQQGVVTNNEKRSVKGIKPPSEQEKALFLKKLFDSGCIGVVAYIL